MKKLYIFALMVAFLSAYAFATECDGDEPPPRDKPAVVNIVTEPPNSDVFLGGEPLGKSPITNLNVKSGRQTLVVIDQGYELVNKRVNIWPGKDKCNDFDFGTKIPKGHVKITTVPGKCNVYVDGDLADKTDGAPLTVHNLEAGDHVIRAECNNRKAAEELVTVKGEETVNVTIDTNKKKSGKK